MARRRAMTHRRVGQRSKGPIDPRLGARIRELRVARGMTQATLAGHDFTKGFISLLETGRTRASMRATEILAHRLGTSAPELISSGGRGGAEVDLMVIRADQHVAAGRPQDAIELMDRAISDSSGVLRARALRIRGRALVEAGRPREAIAALEEAARAFESLGEREMVIRTTYDRAVAHAHLDEPGNALALALESEASLRAGGFVDRTLELQVRSLLAATFARAGDLESADQQARLALDLASDVVDTDALATLYSTLSVTRQRMGDIDSALGYARQSLALYEGLGRQRAVGQMWHNVAGIHIAKGDLRRATEAIGRADRIAADAQLPGLQARLLALRAELALAERKSAEAERLAAAGTTHASAAAVTRAGGLIARLKVRAAAKAPAGALQAIFDQATAALADEPPPIRAAAHAAYAEILSRRGDPHGP